MTDARSPRTNRFLAGEALDQNIAQRDDFADHECAGPGGIHRAVSTL
jgi:hypothetical protein